MVVGLCLPSSISKFLSGSWRSTLLSIGSPLQLWLFAVWNPWSNGRDNSINKHKQNWISRKVINTWKACDSLSLSIPPLLDWPSNSEERDGILDPRHHGLWLPSEMGLYRILSPREAQSTCLRNRELGPMSGFWGSLCENANGPGKEEGEGLLQGCLT